MLISEGSPLIAAHSPLGSFHSESPSLSFFGLMGFIGQNIAMMIIIHPYQWGIVWNIETPSTATSDRPKSRVRSVMIQKQPRVSPSPATHTTTHTTTTTTTTTTTNTTNREETTTIATPTKEGGGGGGGGGRRPLFRPLSANNILNSPITNPSHQKPSADPSLEVVELPAQSHNISSNSHSSHRSQSAQGATRPASRSHHQRNPANHPPLPHTKILSNYTQTKNAINYVCLAGAHQEEKRREVLDLLDYYHSNRDYPPPVPPDLILHEDFKGKINHFLLLFYKAKSLAFKSIYLYDSHEKRLIKVFGRGGPAILSDSDPLIKEFMKFETSSKSFKSLPVKAISSTIDAIILEPPKAK